jgi:signal transduction histidine kinase
MRILLLDDNPQDRFLALRELQREFAGCEIKEVFDPATLSHELEHGRYDLVVTDYQMPWTDGLAVLKQVKERNPFCPVVMFTATATQETAVAAMKAGLDDYVVKSPAHFIRLPAAARSSLEHSAARRREAEWRAEREKLVEQLQEANRIKDEFLAMVSHELRTPLTSIVGWTRLLRSVAKDPKKLDDAIDSLDRNGKRLIGLVSDLLDFSTLALGEKRREIHQFDLRNTLKHLVEDFRRAVETRQLAIETDLDTPIVFEGDETQIRRVFENLIANAIKFTPAGGHIAVLARMADRHAEVTVTDTGIGIDPKFQPHVFGRFRQADPSITRSYGGLGLGLALAKEIVDLHGGTIHVQSPGPGQGSTFLVRLPLKDVGD